MQVWIVFHKVTRCLHSIAPNTKIGKGKIGELSCRFGTTHSEETKEKMRLAWQKRKQNKQQNKQ